MKTPRNNFAFIDGQNVYQGVQSLGWSFDLGKLRVHLAQRYHVTTAYYFIGHMTTPQSRRLYQALESAGFVLQFKPVVQNAGHMPKGNVDADLVLKVMVDLPVYDEAVIVSGDGDFYSLVDHLRSTNKLYAVIAPNRR